MIQIRPIDTVSFAPISESCGSVLRGSPIANVGQNMQGRYRRIGQGRKHSRTAMTQKRAASIVPDIVTKDDLHAFVDGALSPSRHAEIADYIRDHDDASSMVDEIRRLNELLRQRSGGTADSPVPDRLTRLVQELAEAIDRRSQAR
jgi:hypothetical protein